MGRSTHDFHNEVPGKAPPHGVTRDQIKIDFANRLQKALGEKGWSQSDLARQASKHLPKNRPLGRDNVSHYVRAVSLPRSYQLQAIAQSLGMKVPDLMPTPPSATMKAPPFDMRQLEDGNVWLRINQGVTFDQALQIMKILNAGEPS